jgi:hypothetical protein
MASLIFFQQYTVGTEAQFTHANSFEILALCNTTSQFRSNLACDISFAQLVYVYVSLHQGTIASAPEVEHKRKYRQFHPNLCAFFRNSGQVRTKYAGLDPITNFDGPVTRGMSL